MRSLDINNLKWIGSLKFEIKFLVDTMVDKQIIKAVDIGDAIKQANFFAALCEGVSVMSVQEVEWNI